MPSIAGFFVWLGPVLFIISMLAQAASESKHACFADRESSPLKEVSAYLVLSS